MHTLEQEINWERLNYEVAQEEFQLNSQQHIEEDEALASFFARERRLEDERLQHEDDQLRDWEALGI